MLLLYCTRKACSSGLAKEALDLAQFKDNKLYADPVFSSPSLCGHRPKGCIPFSLTSLPEELEQDWGTDNQHGGWSTLPAPRRLCPAGHAALGAAKDIVQRAGCPASRDPGRGRQNVKHMGMAKVKELGLRRC